MPTFVYCNVAIASNISIPELPQSSIDKTDIIFTLASTREKTAGHNESHHWYASESQSVFSYRKQGTDHWLRFESLADFRISANAREITCYPFPEIPEETIRHLILDQVLPRCLAHSGKIILHASAVWLEQGLLLFLGDSGAGKSTMAGNFHQAGMPAVSDDCVLIQGNLGEPVRAMPSYSGLRLWEDSLEIVFAAEKKIYSMAHYSAKKRVLLKENEILRFGDGLPVLAVIVLSPASQTLVSQIILDRLSLREAFIALMKQSFQLRVMGPNRIKRHMKALAYIVPRLPAYRLSMPHNYELLPIVRQKILETVLIS